LVEDIYNEKNLAYFIILKPLKLEIADFKFYINGIKELLKTIKLEEFMVYKSIKTLTFGPIPHFIVTNDKGTSGQVLTSSKLVWSKEKNKFIEADLLHIKNTKPQYSILSAIDQNNLHDFVLTNT
jgi:hypothetical protein